MQNFAKLWEINALHGQERANVVWNEARVGKRRLIDTSAAHSWENVRTLGQVCNCSKFCSFKTFALGTRFMLFFWIWLFSVQTSLCGFEIFLWCLKAKFRIPALRRRMFVNNTTIRVVFEPNTTEKKWCLSWTPHISSGIWLKFWNFEALNWVESRAGKSKSLIRWKRRKGRKRRIWLCN